MQLLESSRPQVEWMQASQRLLLLLFLASQAAVVLSFVLIENEEGM